MSTIIAIVGESGTGKSTAIRTLDPKATVIISPISKPLPIKGFKKNYNEANKNWFCDVEPAKLIALLENISKSAPAIKSIVIDDFQYQMSGEFMERALEHGYSKFTEIGQKAYNVLKKAANLRADLNVFFLVHEDSSEVTGKRKIKTVGKMLDDKISLEGLFTIVLFAEIHEGKYQFKTQSDGNTTAKSPMGMFDQLEIPNDLGYVLTKIKEYYGE